MGFTAPSGWNIWKMRFEKQSEGESDMKYYSTRDAAVRMDAAEAIKMGLSRDGGLLTPCGIPQIDRAFLESLVNVRCQEWAAKVMGLYPLTDYTMRSCPDLRRTPTALRSSTATPWPLSARWTRPPTAWSCGTAPPAPSRTWPCRCLPQCSPPPSARPGVKTVCILVATSGDTGKVMMEGFADVPQTKILVFYPKDGVSKVQRPRWSLRTGPMWASAPWRATSATPRPV